MLQQFYHGIGTIAQEVFSYLQHHTAQELDSWYVVSTLILSPLKTNFEQNLIPYPDALSSTNRKAEDDALEAESIPKLQIILELLILLGIHPRLLCGISIPLENRFIFEKDKHWKQLLVQLIQQNSLAETQKLESTALLQLLSIIQFFFQIAIEWKLDFISHFVLQHYSVDMMSGLLQLLYTLDQTRKYIVMDVHTLHENSSPSSLVKIIETNHWFSLQQKQQIQTMLHQFLNQVSEEVILRSCLTLTTQKQIAPWCKELCQQWLSNTLLRSNGVYALFFIFLQPRDASALDATQNFERVTQLLTTIPKQVQSMEEYYQKIGPQLVTLFQVGRVELNYMRRGAAYSTAKLISKSKKWGVKYLLNPLMKPLLQFQKLSKEIHLSEKNSKGNRILISEKQLVQCIEDLHLLFTGVGPSLTIIDCLSSVISALFQLYCFVSRTKLYAKSACEELISTYFKCSDNAMEVIKSLVKVETPKKNTSDQFVIFSPGESGGVCVKIASESNRNYLWEAECIITILKLTKNESFAGDLFVHLISQFTFLKEQIKNQNVIIEEDETISQHSLRLLSVIKLIIDNLGVSIMKNTNQTLSLIKFLLLSHEEDTTEEGVETITMALGLLSTIVCGQIPISTQEEESKLQDLNVILKRFESHPEQQVTEMVSTIALAISTQTYHNAVPNAEDTLQSKTQFKLKTILTDLRDPIVPIRAYAIHCLRQLVQDKDETIAKHLKKVLEVFQSQLKEEDTFIYLGAIQGLATMADRFPEQTIPSITKSFNDSTIDVETRLKVGEVLVQIAQRFGPLLTTFASFFVNSFLYACRSKPKQMEEEQVYARFRESSLSNLATICEMLKYGIHPYLQDIIDCTEQVLSVDKDVQVRRAALFVFTRLIKGIGVEVTDILSQHLEQMITLLKKVEFYDTDSLIRHNANELLVQVEELKMQKLTPTFLN